MHQFVDPQVTSAKYEQELDRFYEQEGWWRERGVFLLKDNCPLCEFLFLTPQIFPLGVSFAVHIDFTNYDAAPPSVRFIHPFSGKELQRNEIPFQFKQRITEERAKELKVADPSEGIDLCVSIEGGPPFLCHRGTKEYHDHPYHDGDSWLLHRGNEGRLYRILHLLQSTSIGLFEDLELEKPVFGAKKIFKIKQRKP
jgi:hypothetical protein